MARTMRRAQFKRLDLIARKAAGYYARRCWWADRSDLVQEAWLAIVRAGNSFDPSVGVPFEAYAWRACIRALYGYIWKQSAPVSGRGDTLRGLHRASLDLIVEHAVSDSRREIEEAREWAQWCERAKGAIEFALRKVDPELQVNEVADLVTKDLKPRHIAAIRGRKVQEIYKTRLKAEVELLSSRELRGLWKEMR